MKLRRLALATVALFAFAWPVFAEETQREVVRFKAGIKTDTISEATSATGVTADSVLLKDGAVGATGVDRTTAGALAIGAATATSVAITPATTVTGALYPNGGIDRSSAAGLAIGAANATSVTITPATTVTGALYANGGVDRSAAAVLSIGATNATSVNIVPMLTTGYGIGTLGAGGTSVVERSAPVHQTVITLTAKAMTLVDDGANGHFSAKVYDAAAGYIRWLGQSTDLACTSAGTMGATPTLTASLGTTGTADATLNGTDVNLGASTSTGAFVANAGNIRIPHTATESIVTDGHTTATPVYLNIADAADPDADSVLTCTGTITLDWINGGDN